MMDVAIRVDNLVKVYARRNQPPVRAVDRISFLVKRGEIFGLLGPNGAGKSTTLKVLTTLLPPTSGSIQILGFDVAVQPLEVRKNICVVLQENAVELHLSVHNNFRTFGRFHGLGWSEIEKRSNRVIDLFGLREYLGEKGMDLSGGLKRRLQVAKMFMLDTPIVFLDEATTGMDAFNKRTTLEAIREEAGKGRTVVLTTHLLDEAEQLCDSVAIINHGAVVAQGRVEEVKSMGLRLIFLSLTFDRMTKKILKVIERSSPVRMETKDSTVELSVRDEAAALKILAAAHRAGSLRKFEVASASLEDVFVELLDKKERAT